MTADPRRSATPYVGPFFCFAAFLLLPDLLRSAGAHQHAPPLWLRAPELVVYPLQTLVCGFLLVRYRRDYPWKPFGWQAALLGLGTGVLVFVLWIAPQILFGQRARVSGGFDPTPLLPVPWLYNVTVAARFLRLVVVVPWLEEVFWRGYALRRLVSEEFRAVPFGAWNPLSFAAVTLGFMLEHAVVDWPAALLAGALYNAAALRSRSLPACILAHGVTNLLLGVYIMRTRQWGFW